MSLKAKIKNNKFFSNAFGFESGIDITDDTKVLYRKNIVIKNIIFVSNLIFTLMFAFLSFGERSNIVLTFILFPVTFLVNAGLKKTINKNPEDKTTQTIASYVACFYMFLLSLVIYFKLKYGSADYLKECGYILIYYSLVVCSFYQDKKLLKFVFEWVMVLVTILHFTVTYEIMFSDIASDFKLFFTTFFTSNEFKDILIRTILLGIFMLVLYSIVSMSGYMQEERKKELMKRREVQENFTSVVTKIFDATLADSSRSEADKNSILLASVMARRLAELLNLPEEECLQIETFAKIHVERTVNFIPQGASEDEKFEMLKEQTDLGSIIISRLQIERRLENIMRAPFEGSDTEEFILSMKSVGFDTPTQIIMICDLYVNMRNIKSFKKALNHKLSMQYMTDRFKIYFDDNIFERFVRFGDEFEKIYDDNEGETYDL